MSGFLVKKWVKNKKNIFAKKLESFRSKWEWGQSKSEKRKVFTTNRWSYHNMVSPQNGDTRGGLPPAPPPSSDATAEYVILLVKVKIVLNSSCNLKLKRTQFQLFYNF